ncbi:S-layer homology domain-containing protein [Peptoniphilus stercorisuis]|uniref:SLH domain-containing protein n=1 Tax=Peptoniphilus stercorisuis TaxID=1436965 RepID=A0ABS4KCX1_9FIRM|nr:S-layer homology domain-containing protein [Peptoniphilus stercorisuis]MBP2025631.1 hypothetical protein [Peptoniphilus stercorisuis]
MNKKKWTSLFLAFVMVLGILPLNVFAEENDGGGSDNTTTSKVTVVKSITVTPKQSEIVEGTDKAEFEIKSTTEEYDTESVGADTKINLTVSGGDSGVKLSKTEIKDLNGTAIVTVSGLKGLKDGTKIKVTATSDKSEKTGYGTVTIKAKETTKEVTITIKPKGDGWKSTSSVDVTVDKNAKFKYVRKKFENKLDDKLKSNADVDAFYRNSNKKNKIKDSYEFDGNETIYAYTDRDKNDKDNDLKRIYPTDKERDGRYVEGKEKDYKNTKVYVYKDKDAYDDGDSEVGSGWTDSDGKYRIRLDFSPSSSEFKDLVYYVDKDSKNDDNLTRVYPKDVELYDKSSGEYRKVKGKLSDYEDTKVYVYLDGDEIGYGTTDRNGKFDFKLDDYVDADDYDEDDLKFYVKDSKNLKTPFVTRFIAGETKVEGKDATDGATIEVQDSNGTKLGSTTADRDGKFTVSLNRALKGGETINVIAKKSGKNDVSVKVIVAGGIVGGPSESTATGYIKGYPGGEFRPNNNMTRGEAAMMMARLINGSENFGTSKLTNFSDANYEWYSEAINFVVAKGLINGYPNGTFNPNGKITRAEFTQMISKYLTTNGTKQINFNDVSGHWAQPAINKVASGGIIDGYTDGSFKPNKEITRAEASKILNGTFGVTSTGSYTKYFTDVKKSDWFYNDVMNAANYK